MFKPPTNTAALGRLQRNAARTVVASAVMLIAASLALSSTLSTGAQSGLSAVVLIGAKALFVFATALALFARALPEHLPHERLGPANLVTLIRLALCALLAGLLAEQDNLVPWLSVGIAALALALDGLDGWLARRGNWSSRFGATFDMETDALLILLLSLLVWQFDKAGAWVMLAGLTRYLFVLSASLVPWLRGELPPSWRRKFVCVVQAASLLIALMPVVPAPYSTAIALSGLLALLYSFAVDVIWLHRHGGQTTAQDSLS